MARPDLADRPVIVGGDESRRRGIVLAKNNLAKRMGVKTAETIYQARRKCPNAVILPPHREWYRDFSERAMAIYRRYTERLQPFGPDEAWLDVSERKESGPELAYEIKAAVLQELGLNVSIGVSWNKTFAKMGSDYRKPAAVTVITRENYKDILWPLPVGRFLFVGEVTAERLMSLGIRTIGDLAAREPEEMEVYLGKHGRSLVLTARGEDDSPVLTEAEQGPPKSVGAMETTARDLSREEEAAALFKRLAEQVERRAKKAGQRGFTVRITVKNRDFVSKSRQRKLSRAVDEAEPIYETALALFREHFSDEHAIRLLGITLDQLEPADAARQMSLLDWAEEASRTPEPDSAKGSGGGRKPEDRDGAEEAEALLPEAGREAKEKALDGLLAELQGRFGKASVIKASELSREEEAPDGS